MPLDGNDGFDTRAEQMLHRDLTGTGYAIRDHTTCHTDGDHCIFRCLIYNKVDEIEAIWIYVESQVDGRFSTYFLF